MLEDSFGSPPGSPPPADVLADPDPVPVVRAPTPIFYASSAADAIRVPTPIPHAPIAAAATLLAERERVIRELREENNG